MANGTLVTIARDVSLVRCTQRSIAIDTTVDFLVDSKVGERNIQWREAVGRMRGTGGNNTVRAVVKVGAGQALVTYSDDGLDTLLVM